VETADPSTPLRFGRDDTFYVAHYLVANYRPRTLEVVGLADSTNFFEVMPAVHELEHAPLADIEWTEDRVTGALAGGTKEGLGFGEEQVEMGEVFGGGLGEVFAGEWMRGWWRRDKGRGLAAGGEVSVTSDCVLKEALPEGGLGSGRSAFREAGVDTGFGAGIGEEQMLDDLLDAPPVVAGGRA
jgi:hypothetical protein